MVQLPATAAIEYVAACWVSGGGGGGGAIDRGTLVGIISGAGDFWPGDFCLGVLLSGGSFARGDFGPGGLCPFPRSSMRIRTV